MGQHLKQCSLSGRCEHPELFRWVVETPFKSEEGSWLFVCVLSGCFRSEKLQGLFSATHISHALHKTLPCFPFHLQDASPSPCLRQRLLVPLPHHNPCTYLIPGTLASFLFCKRAKPSLPQGLCTCCSICLQCPYTRHPACTVPPFPQISAQMAPKQTGLPCLVHTDSTQPPPPLAVRIPCLLLLCTLIVACFCSHRSPDYCKLLAEMVQR